MFKLVKCAYFNWTLVHVQIDIKTACVSMQINVYKHYAQKLLNFKMLSMIMYYINDHCLK